MPTLAATRSQTQGPEKTYAFTLLLLGPSPLDHLDALFEVGCDDAIFGERAGLFFAEFDRTATSLAEAVGMAIAQVESAVPALRVARVEPDELVNAAAIAARTGRTRESVRLLIEHRRGPGHFPPPICWLNSRTRLWHWSDVARWFEAALGEHAADADEATIVAALNAALDLRNHAANLAEPAARQAVAALLRAEVALRGN